MAGRCAEGGSHLLSSTALSLEDGGKAPPDKRDWQIVSG